MKHSIAKILIVVVLFTGVFVASTIEAGALSKKQTFYKMLDKKGIDHKGAIRLARTFCTTVDDMSVKDAIVQTVLKIGKKDINAEDGSYIIAAGVLVYCPQYKAKMTEFVKSS
jgi:hypothetical protein